MKRHPRQGYTLVEVVAVMGATAVLLTTIGTTLHLMVRVTSEVRQAEVSQATWDRFVVRLQADAHRAREAEVTADALTLVGVGWKVVYTSSGRDIVRSITQEDQASQRERYQLPAGGVANWGLVESPNLLVRCTCDKTGDAAELSAALTTPEILAAVGLEARE